MAEIIMKGAPVADSICAGLKSRSDALRQRGTSPCLAILRVGQKQGDLSYERGAMKRCAALDIAVKNVILPETVTQSELIDTVRALNEDGTVHGVLILRPLPRGVDESLVCGALKPSKDVDGITEASMAAVYSGSDGFAPCTAQAVLEMLKFYAVELCGKRATVIGRSLVIGKPVSMLLLRENATVTLCHSKTEGLPQILKEADIVIAAAGHKNAVTAQCLRAGQAVADVGINWDEEKQKLCGDVDYEAAESIVAAISPVPGGVGSVTTSVLALHVIEAAERKD